MISLYSILNSNMLCLFEHNFNNLSHSWLRSVGWVLKYFFPCVEMENFFPFPSKQGTLDDLRLAHSMNIFRLIFWMFIFVPLCYCSTTPFPFYYEMEMELSGFIDMLIPQKSGKSNIWQIFFQNSNINPCLVIVSVTPAPHTSAPHVPLPSPRADRLTIACTLMY